MRQNPLDFSTAYMDRKRVSGDQDIMQVRAYRGDQCLRTQLLRH